MAPPRRLRFPRGTLRIQLALLCAGFFAACGVVLLVPVLTIRSSLPDNVTPAILAQTNADVRDQIIRAAAILVALSALSLGAGWLIAGRFLRPLRTITATARNISANDLSRRVALGRRDDEFAELGATLDSLFARLEASFESQRRFVANASHELRTPLAAERTLLQVALADTEASAQALRSACQDALMLGDQQERLIEALLTLASDERGVEQWEPFDLAELAGQVVGQRRAEARRLDVRLQAELSTAPATGDPRLVESLVANLVDNALRHNGPGGWAEVSTSMTAGRVTIRVCSSGPVVPPGDLDRLFQPFQRLGRERIGSGGGHGLGLAIVSGPSPTRTAPSWPRPPAPKAASTSR
jgi:signal transduction histidine kinase